MSRGDRVKGNISGGFTLAELLIVIVIMGILAIAAIPDFSAATPNKIQLATAEIAQAMRFARSEAIRTGRPHGFRQQSSAKRIRVFRPDTTVSPWVPVYDINHPLSKKLYDIDLNTHPFASVGAITLTPTFRGSCNVSGNIYFDSNGIPRCMDPQTVLLDNFIVSLTLDMHTRDITLQGITGRVTVQ